MATLPPHQDRAFEEINPYAPPEATLTELEPFDLGGDLAEVEAIRRKHLNHEASVRSIGSLHYFGAVVGFFIGFCDDRDGLVVTASNRLPGECLCSPRSSLFYLVLGGLQLALGIGLRRLQSWARWTDVAFIAVCRSGSRCSG